MPETLSKTLHRSDFHFDLPEQLIARFPVEKRSDSRMLYINRCKHSWQDNHFNQLADFLSPGDLIVFNDTKVIPARLFGHKASGGKCEVLIERILDDTQVQTHIRASKSPKIGSTIIFSNDIQAQVIQREEDLFILNFNSKQPIIELLNDIGHIPLPPYINRNDEKKDLERYQTVYAKHAGAVAAPTAGLHFDNDLLQKLQNNGINTAFITLHVGAGTFQPVRVDNISEHKMHKEVINVSPSVCDQIHATKQNGKRVIAVGTTVVRSLETAACTGVLKPFTGETNIFITPGCTFNVIDGLITNFHLPESTLLMLVAAFAGLDITLNAYQHAINNYYRFYSYGDGMLIL